MSQAPRYSPHMPVHAGDRLHQKNRPREYELAPCKPWRSGFISVTGDDGYRCQRPHLRLFHGHMAAHGAPLLRRKMRGSIQHCTWCRTVPGSVLLLLLLLLAVQHTVAEICVTHFASPGQCTASLPSMPPMNATCFPEGTCSRISSNVSAVFTRNATLGVDVLVYAGATCTNTTPTSLAIANGACTSGTPLDPSWAAVWCKLG